ncbi:alpha/beta hydrolase [Chryseobacterium nematophagum]|uniref:Alpha/beta hydrolase n=1 Tax=Chryseobacterium nematophagum TaxID=2305228 RepID=A0A3M7L9S5_9FLAO|nr:alpha/beta hydrolase [Chryseobacterium nematophagum]RMZ58775.1 alpha/beta hydrolase [Chryseobacterium nematophagum]
MKIFIIIFICLLSNTIQGQEIYSKAYGDPKNPAIIFIHGGPGGNSISFEMTTAFKLASKGFYVIVYDRKGEGRSNIINADYTFKQTFEDIDDIYIKYNITKASLMGFSFGGMISTLYTKKEPQKVDKLILISALLYPQETFSTILNNAQNIYTKNKDFSNLENLNSIRLMNRSSLEFRKKCFGEASKNNFLKEFKTNKLWDNVRKDEVYKTYSAMNDEQASIGFFTNEKYTSINVKDELKKISNTNQFYAIYGNNDMLYPSSLIQDLKNILPSKNVFNIKRSAHYIYIDNQKEFLNIIIKILK